MITGDVDAGVAEVGGRGVAELVELGPVWATVRLRVIDAVAPAGHATPGPAGSPRDARAPQ